MADHGYELDAALQRRMRGNVVRFEDRRLTGDGLKHAAVALTVVAREDTGEAAFLLTRRAANLNSHSGQWALPGGRVDAGETAVEAALRELDEEVGVRLPETAVLGFLDDYPTRSGYRITPVVVWGGADVSLNANAAEVAAVYRIPLRELDRPGSPQFTTIPESERPVVKVLIGDSQVHAPTAAVIYQFREVAMYGRDTRVDHLEQPVWAWR